MDLMIRRRLMMQKIQGGEELPPLGQIWYWTSDGTQITPTTSVGIESHTYTDKGIITVESSYQTRIKTWFEDNTKVTKIRLADGVTNIETWAFMGCTSLVSINLPKSLTSIGTSVFQECTSLISINLPEFVTSMSGVFRECTSLETVTCFATNPPTIDRNCFRDCLSLAHIYVPASSVDAYKTANGWLAYAKIISAIPE